MKRNRRSSRYPSMRLGFSILFVLSVLFSTTGLPRVQHLCGGIVQSVSLVLSTSGCAHEAQVASCHAKPVVKEDSHASPTSCCKSEVTKEKDCCTDELSWEPSQLDLAIGDHFVLDGAAPIHFQIETYQFVLLPSSLSQTPYARPPPPPLIQGRRRALLQVYRC